MPIKVVIKKNSKYGILYRTPSHIRYILTWGGRATGRSFQNSRADIINLTTWPYYRGFLMRNVLDQVRDSIYQDCLDRINELNLGIKATESNLLLKYKKNQLKGRGFRKSSGTDTAKNKSVAGINTITIEEAEETDKDDFNQLDLSLRTVKGQVVIKLLFNPPIKGHWILKEWFNLVPASKENAEKYYGKCWFESIPESALEGFFIAVPKSDRTDTHYIFGTYHDNKKNLDKNTIAKMERFKETDIDYYLHKICGLVPSGKVGRVIKRYSTISVEEYDKLPYTKHYGLDFGFTNDPTACIEIMRHNNKLYLRERLYERGLTNPQIYERLKWIKAKIKADSSEPKSIKELNDLGLFVEGAEKGPDSISVGIQRLNQFEIIICEDSKNLMEESENHVYKLDKNKEPTNQPEDDWNHAIDATRYGIEDMFNYTDLSNLFSF